MACLFPLRAFKTEDGVAFNPTKSGATLPLDLPCGQCHGCKIDKARTWAIRCVHESQLHDRNSFITLTYDPKFLPRDASVSVRTWQLFAKRLRKKIGKFRYFMCAEYGDTNLRPHYHALIFGHDFRDDRIDLTERSYGPVWTSPTLINAWSNGFVEIGQLNYTTACYISKYVLKKITGDNGSHYLRVDHENELCFEVSKEFGTMSRNPGIGSDWLKRFGNDVYPSDEVIHEGKRFRPPRFYDDRLKPDQLERLKQKRRRNALKRSADLKPARLEARQKILKARESLRPRDL